MMKLNIAALLTVCWTIAAFAAPVDETMAKRAIGAWRARGGALGLKMGHVVGDVRRVEKDGAALARRLLKEKAEARSPLVLKGWGEGDRVADWQKIAGN